MLYNKQNFVDGDTLTAENLNHIEDGVYQNEERTNNLEKTVGGTYELVEEITTTEDLTSFARTAFPDGTAYKFKAAKVKLKTAPGAGTGQVNVQYQNTENKDWVTLGTSSTQTIATSLRYQWSRVWREHGMWECEFSGGNSSEYAVATYKMAGYSEVINNLNVTRIEVKSTTSGIPIPAGTRIQIYGVRA